MSDPNTTHALPPVTLSGVERLNSDLGLIIHRLNLIQSRVGNIANQFGAQPTESISPRTTKSPESTNDFMLYLSNELSNLERIISRIDNQ